MAFPSSGHGRQATRFRRTVPAAYFGIPPLRLQLFCADTANSTIQISGSSTVCPVIERAVAVAIGLFGLNSGAALATVVEVPVMLLLVAIASDNQRLFPYRPGRTESKLTQSEGMWQAQFDIHAMPLDGVP